MKDATLRQRMLDQLDGVIASLPADPFLNDRIAQLQPDLIIVDAESAARDALEHVVMATRDERRPIVLFTNDDDTTHVKDAVAAGVSAYIVAGLAPDRIRPSGRSPQRLHISQACSSQAGNRIARLLHSFHSGY